MQLYYSETETNHQHSISMMQVKQERHLCNSVIQPVCTPSIVTRITMEDWLQAVNTMHMQLYDWAYSVLQGPQHNWGTCAAIWGGMHNNVVGWYGSKGTSRLTTSKLATHVRLHAKRLGVSDKLVATSGSLTLEFPGIHLSNLTVLWMKHCS